MLEMSNRRGRGFTLVELMIGLALLVVISGIVFYLFFSAAGRSKATDKKNETLRAAIYVAGRIRRDAWRAIKVEFGGASPYRAVRFLLPDGKYRIYQWDENTMVLNLPSLTEPSNIVPYQLARFRHVEFIRDQDNPAVLRFVLNVYPLASRPHDFTAEDIKFSTTYCGEVCPRRNVAVGNNPYFNFEFNDPQPSGGQGGGNSGSAGVGTGFSSGGYMGSGALSGSGGYSGGGGYTGGNNGNDLGLLGQ